MIYGSQFMLNTLCENIRAELKKSGITYTDYAPEISKDVSCKRAWPINYDSVDNVTKLVEAMMPGQRAQKFSWDQVQQKICTSQSVPNSKLFCESLQRLTSSQNQTQYMQMLAELRGQASIPINRKYDLERERWNLDFKLSELKKSPAAKAENEKRLADQKKFLGHLEVNADVANYLMSQGLTPEIKRIAIKIAKY